MKKVTIKTNVSGITLITLVVTVIVLMILAGITFSTLLGENGVLNFARNEANAAQKSAAKEKIRLEVAGSQKSKGEYVAANIKNNILAHIDNSQVLRDEFPIVTTVDGYTFAIDSKGIIFDANFDYLVQFDGNGIAGIMNSQEFAFGESKNLHANKYNHDGYTFANWNTKPDGSGRKFDDEELVSALTSIKYDVVVLYAQWVQGTAQMDGVNYDTLQEAINAVPTNNIRKTIRLLTNTKENISIAPNQNILFDLQNHTIRVRDYESLAVVENKGTIEITNGTIKSDSLKTATINNNSGGKITISSGKVLMEATAGKQALYNNGGTVEITGTAYLSSESSTAAGGYIRATVQNQAGSTLNITGGTIISKNFYGIRNYGLMTIGVKDGTVHKNLTTIQGAEYGVYCDAKFNFYDGTIKGKTNAINNISYVEDKETGYQIASLDEGISGETYKTVYLSTTVAVNFNPNGGTVDETTRNVESGRAIGTLPIPTRSGFEFAGWFTESSGGEEITERTEVEAATTYYAHWTPLFTVTFNPDGGTVGETTRGVANGKAIGTLPIPTKDKYDFVGWFTKKGSSGEEITAETIVEGNITYYAHWNKIMYAQVNGQQYDTIAKAINAIPTDGTETTLTIIRNTTENVTIKKGQNIVLDIGDNTLNTSSNAAVITNNGTVKITSGTVASTVATGTINNNKDGTLIIDGARITGKERAAVYNDGGTVTIQGDSYLESTAGGYAPDSSGLPLERATINNINGGKITITGGKIVGINNAAVCNDASTLTIGVPDGSISTTSPVLIGNTYGIKNGAKSGKTYTFNFYDGIAGGITGNGIAQQANKTTVGAEPGTITAQEQNTQLASGTIVIDGKTYKTNYLEAIQ